MPITAFAPAPALERILEGHRTGLCDKMRTLDLVGKLRDQLPESGRAELRAALGRLFEVSEMGSQNVGGYIVNMAALTLSCLADDCPFPRLLELVVRRLPVGDLPKTEVWAQEIVGELEWNLMRYQHRVDADAVNRIKAQVALARSRPDLYQPSGVAALERLGRSAEWIEFQRFAKALSSAAEAAELPIELGHSRDPKLALSPTVAKALSEAYKRLQAQGEFDAKTAADLIRGAIDEAHREFVASLGSIKQERYTGEDKDGARRIYMCSVGFITQPEEKFFSAIYSLISREASHKLDAPRETILLLYRTVLDYLLLLTERLNHQLANHSG